MTGVLTLKNRRGQQLTLQMPVAPALQDALAAVGLEVGAKGASRLVDTIAADGAFAGDEHLVGLALAAALAPDIPDVVLRGRANAPAHRVAVPEAAKPRLRNELVAALAQLSATPAVSTLIGALLQGRVPLHAQLEAMRMPASSPVPAPAVKPFVVGTASSARIGPFTRGSRIPLPADPHLFAATLEHLRRQGTALAVDASNDGVTGYPFVARVDQVTAGDPPCASFFSQAALNAPLPAPLTEIHEIRVLEDVPAIGLHEIDVHGPVASKAPPARTRAELATHVARSGLTAEGHALLARHSAGVHDVATFLRTYRPGVQPVALYCQYHEAIKAAFCAQFGVMDWEQAYDRLHLVAYGETRLVNHTEVFLEMLTARGHEIVFFVPDDVMTHPHAHFTRRELAWMLSHPERLGNVHFVFGADAALDFADHQWLARSYPDRSTRHAAMLQRACAP